MRADIYVLHALIHLLNHTLLCLGTEPVTWRAKQRIVTACFPKSTWDPLEKESLGGSGWQCRTVSSRFGTGDSTACTSPRDCSPGRSLGSPRTAVKRQVSAGIILAPLLSNYRTHGEIVIAVPNASPCARNLGAGHSVCTACDCGEQSEGDTNVHVDEMCAWR